MSRKLGLVLMVLTLAAFTVPSAANAQPTIVWGGGCGANSFPGTDACIIAVGPDLRADFYVHDFSAVHVGGYGATFIGIWQGSYFHYLYYYSIFTNHTGVYPAFYRAMVPNEGEGRSEVDFYTEYPHSLMGTSFSPSSYWAP